MGHTLEALIIPSEATVMAKAMLRHTHPVPLAQGLFLVPILAATFDELRERFPDVIDPVEPDLWKFSGPIALIAERLSHLGAVAYVETDYFGGVGNQAAMVWRAGEVIMPATKDEAGPINAALRLLGVKARPPHDEFDSVGLGAHRHNEDWLGLEAD